MTSNVEPAQTCFSSGFNRMQPAFSTYSPESGIEPNDALRIATGFGGPLQDMCGSLTEAFMVIGCKDGRIRSIDNDVKKQANANERKLVHRFRILHGSISSFPIPTLRVYSGSSDRLQHETNDRP